MRLRGVPGWHHFEAGGQGLEGTHRLRQNGINKIFDLFDDDRTGSINSSNIRRVAKELGETMNVQELEEMLQRAASNGRDISREDFYNIMTKKTF